MQEIQDLQLIINTAIEQHSMTVVNQVRNMLDQHKNSQIHPNRSQFVDLLYSALAIAQGQYREVGYNRKDTFFEDQYADRHIVRLAVQEALDTNGLSVRFEINTKEDKGSWLTTILAHKSGQFTSMSERIIANTTDEHSYYSSLNQQMKHAYMSILGITIRLDRFDDNGAESMRKLRKEQKSPISRVIDKTPAVASDGEESRDRITRDQKREIEKTLDGHEDYYEDLLVKYQLKDLSDLPRSKYEEVIDRAREIVAVAKGWK